MTDQLVSISVEFSRDQAWAFAQFLKRVGYSNYKTNAVDDDEAHLMLDAGEKVRGALADAGYAPR